MVVVVVAGVLVVVAGVLVVVAGVAVVVAVLLAPVALELLAVSDPPQAANDSAQKTENTREMKSLLLIDKFSSRIQTGRAGETEWGNGKALRAIIHERKEKLITCMGHPASRRETH